MIKKVYYTALVIVLSLVLTLFVAIPRSQGIVKAVVKNEQVKVSIDATHTPILGIAFHLHYNENWQLTQYELGDFFTQIELPIVLVKDMPEQNKIIVGVSLNQTQALPVGEGGIISFLFEPSNLTQEYEPLAISVSQEKVRGLVTTDFKDLKIPWRVL